MLDVLHINVNPEYFGIGQYAISFNPYDTSIANGIRDPRKTYRETGLLRWDNWTIAGQYDDKHIGMAVLTIRNDRKSLLSKWVLPTDEEIHVAITWKANYFPHIKANGDYYPDRSRDDKTEHDIYECFLNTNYLFEVVPNEPWADRKQYPEYPELSSTPHIRFRTLSLDDRLGSRRFYRNQEAMFVLDNRVKFLAVLQRIVLAFL